MYPSTFVKILQIKVDRDERGSLAKVCMAGERDLKPNTSMGKPNQLKKMCMTILSLEWSPLARVQILVCFGQFATENRAMA